MKCVLAIACIWIPLLILVTGCVPGREIGCTPDRWANNECRDDQDRMAQGVGKSEPRAKPDKPDPDPDPDPDHCPDKR